MAEVTYMTNSGALGAYREPGTAPGLEVVPRIGSLRIVRDGVAKKYRLQELTETWHRRWPWFWLRRRQVSWKTVVVKPWLSFEEGARKEIFEEKDERLKQRDELRRGNEVVWKE